MNRPRSVPRHAGFSMIELLVILLIAMILLTISAPELLKYYIRSQLEGFARETSLVMQRARYRAIKDTQQTQVCADLAGGLITSPAGAIELPDSVRFEAPPPLDAVTVPGNCFVFLTDGSVDEPGAFRIADIRGNFLEIRVEPKATARVQVRKWDEAEGDWYTRDQGGKAWEWKTGKIL